VYRSLAVIGGMLLAVLMIGVNPANAASNAGGLDFNGYCRSQGHSYAALLEWNAYGWKCIAYNGAAVPISATHACQVQWGGNPIDRMANFYDPNSWQCWA